MNLFFVLVEKNLGEFPLRAYSKPLPTKPQLFSTAGKVFFQKNADIYRMKNSRLLVILFISAFAVVCYFPLFLHLDHMSVRLWDEGRRAVNALEMAESGNYLVTSYEGQPEMWGTKPPFLLWCQVFFMKIIGYNEVAVRLPSALAALATIFMLVIFSWKVMKRPLAGFLAGLVLLTTKGYMGAHVARSGDFDALLTLWETAYLLSFFLFLSHTDLPKKRKWMYWMAAFIALAGLTKGIAGFLFLPGLALFYVLYVLGQKEDDFGFVKLLKWKHAWFAALLAFLPLILFYIIREWNNPGYFAAVMDNEMGGRFLETKDGHLKPWYHYFEWLWKEQFQPWLLFLPLGVLAGLWQQAKQKNLSFLLLTNVLVFLSIISYSKTRILWYMAPIYPSLALLVGFGFDALVSGARQLLQDNLLNPKASPTKTILLISAFVVGMFYLPYRTIIGQVYFEQHPSWDWPELKYRDFMRKTKDVMNYTIVHGKYNSNVVFYAKQFNLNGYRIRYYPMVDFNWKKFRFGHPPLTFQTGDTLMVCEKPVFTALDSVYKYQVLRTWDSCKLLVIE